MKGSYRKRFLIGLVGYIVLLWVSLLLLRTVFTGYEDQLGTAVLAGLLALSPMVPLVYMMAAIVGRVRQQDELIKRINLESVLITMLITGGVTFSYGLLQAVELAPDIPLIFVAPFMITVWGFTNGIITRYYDS